MIDLKEVEKSLNILEKDPSNTSANYILSCYLASNNKLSQVYPFISKVLEKKPQLKGAKYILAKYYEEHEKKFIQAIQFYKEELEEHPDSLPTIASLGKALAHIGEIEEAINLHKQYLKYDSSNKLAWDILLMHSHYNPKCSSEELLDYAKQYSKQLSKSMNQKNNFEHLNLSLVKPRLKVGFVSGDLRQHSILFFVHGLFSELNKHCDVYCYCNNQHDQMTELLKKEVLNWRDIITLSDIEAVNLIKKDQIDILIDLSGNTGKNRLDIFSHKPCPVQASWLGQSGPMGLAEMDYMICTEYLVNKDEDQFYLEKPFRLPDIYSTFSTPLDDVAILQPPCLENNYISFGCLNNFMKINNETLSTWVEILKQVPDSKLFLKSKFFSDLDFTRKIQGFFEEKGINKERLILEDKDSKKLQYIKNYNRIDIALDSFPVGGGTTTHDLLWMGVPLIAINGDSFSHRVSASLLNTLGLEELIAQDKSEYIKKAVELANDYKKIEDYKNRIRDLYLKSPICDKTTFAKKFTNALSQMWSETITNMNKKNEI